VEVPAFKGVSLESRNYLPDSARRAIGLERQRRHRAKKNDAEITDGGRCRQAPGIAATIHSQRDSSTRLSASAIEMPCAAA
ncbi:MAG: hypothetical protein K2I37_06605, partial [Muribaculaceae bacterium]|nr:hypothetical protein [Muribaculaceae bacterium]